MKIFLALFLVFISIALFLIRKPIQNEPEKDKKYFKKVKKREENLTLAKGKNIIKVGIKHQRKFVSFKQTVREQVFTVKEQNELSKVCPDGRSFFRMKMHGSWGVEILVFGVKSKGRQKAVYEEILAKFKKTDFRECRLIYYESELATKQNNLTKYKPNNKLSEFSWVN